MRIQIKLQQLDTVDICIHVIFQLTDFVRFAVQSWKQM